MGMNAKSDKELNERMEEKEEPFLDPGGKDRAFLLKPGIAVRWRTLSLSNGEKEVARKEKKGERKERKMS
jgi:hypothetical protein